MKITGNPLFKKHPKNKKLSIVVDGFFAVRGGWQCSINSDDVTNFASIPWPFRYLLDHDDKEVIRAATMHDMLVGEFGPKRMVFHQNTGAVRELTWKEAAVWFREALRHDGVDKLRRRLFYRAVMAWKHIKKLF